ncbi:ABC transporter substrate-binding protein [Roseomonas sp. BN140053]|uniref:ABC transporter substrate-binding protein n=1 Tax=Roseomonas sp. BN140053 TaxID=3391898 RepID=UPI0039E73987
MTRFSLRRPRLPRALLAALLALASPAGAAELRIGLAAEPTSLDPHFHNFWTNVATGWHIFDGLVQQDAQQRLVPGLATGWRALDDRTWEFTLREGVRFSDGGAFTADDVAFTISRIPLVPNSPSSFVVYTGNIEAVEVAGPHTIRIRSREPDPLVPANLSLFAIMGRAQSGGAAPEGRTTAELNTGAGLVGTGPYRFVEWSRGNRLVLDRNPDHWRGAEPWERVTFRPIPNGGARTAALLAGDVDVIENVPLASVAELRNDRRVALWSGPTNQIMYITLDSFAEPSPGVSGTEGRNPLKDPRVRRALSLAIDRQAIAQRLMEGAALPAAELVPPFMFGADPAAAVERFDPAGARQLLAEAGYPNGFRLVLGTASDRYPNIQQVAQAIGSGWGRIGVRTEVDGAPWSAFVGRRNRFEYSAYIGGSQAYSGEMSLILSYLVQTADAASGNGMLNKGRYSNPRLDALLERAKRTPENAPRESLLQQASRVAMEDHAVLPLYFSVLTTGTRAGLRTEPRVDTSILATAIRPVEPAR